MFGKQHNGLYHYWLFSPAIYYTVHELHSNFHCDHGLLGGLRRGSPVLPTFITFSSSQPCEAGIWLLLGPTIFSQWSSGFIILIISHFIGIHFPSVFFLHYTHWSLASLGCFSGPCLVWPHPHNVCISTIWWLSFSSLWALLPTDLLSFWASNWLPI